MKIEKATKKDLYYTDDHEWIDFQGTIAYVGVCAFKLTGFKEIHSINFSRSTGFRKKGDLVATISYHDYHVELRMPVDGKLTQVNEEFAEGDKNLLLQKAEGSGWIVMIQPSQPYERKGLLLPKEYQLNGKSKYAKS